MAMRYTDTEKWNDDWYLSLSPTMKCVWGYVCDKCDGAGLLKLSLRKISSEIGAPVSRDELGTAFGDRILWLSEDRVWVVGFIQFQFRKMSLNNRAHANIAKKALAAVVGIEATGRALKTILYLNEFISNQPSPNDSRPTLERPSTEGQPTDNSYKLIVKSKNLRKGSVREKHSSSPAFDRAYKRYPIKCKGRDAEKRFASQVQTEQDEADFHAALDHYLAYLAKPENSWRKPKQTFSAFIGTVTSELFWRDWISPDAGTVNLPNQPPKESFEEYMKRREAEQRQAVPGGV